MSSPPRAMRRTRRSAHRIYFAAMSGISIGFPGMKLFLPGPFLTGDFCRLKITKSCLR